MRDDDDNTDLFSQLQEINMKEYSPTVSVHTREDGKKNWLIVHRKVTYLNLLEPSTYHEANPV